MKGTQMVHVRMPVNDLKHLDKLSERLSESRSTLIRCAVHEFIDRSICGAFGDLKK